MGIKQKLLDAILKQNLKDCVLANCAYCNHLMTCHCSINSDSEKKEAYEGLPASIEEGTAFVCGDCYKYSIYEKSGLRKATPAELESIKKAMPELDRELSLIRQSINN